MEVDQEQQQIINEQEQQQQQQIIQDPNEMQQEQMVQDGMMQDDGAQQ